MRTPFDHHSVAAGHVGVYWMGQAGFTIRTGWGFSIGINLYLSDCCERYLGFRRLMTPPLFPSEMELDLVIASSARRDHFDVDAIPWLLKPRHTLLLCAPECADECKRLGLSADRIRLLRRDGSFALSGATMEDYDLGDGATGVLIAICSKRILIADGIGRLAEFPPADLPDIDLMILPLCDESGRPLEREAAQAVARFKPACALPSDYWCFAERSGDPMRFLSELRALAPNQRAVLLAMGEGMVL